MGKKNAAGLDVSGAKNPKWKGGLLNKICTVCGKEYRVKQVHHASKYCSMKCVGMSQRGRALKPPEELKRTTLECVTCGELFSVPSSHAHRFKCCSKKCSFKQRAILSAGENNPNWNGGLSRLPYPWDFNKTSKAIILRDGNRCQNPGCDKKDKRLTVHHINYDKQDCSDKNLITLCSSCNSKANFEREVWQTFYSKILDSK